MRRRGWGARGLFAPSRVPLDLRQSLARGTAWSVERAQTPTLPLERASLEGGHTLSVPRLQYSMTSHVSISTCASGGSSSETSSSDLHESALPSQQAVGGSREQRDCSMARCILLRMPPTCQECRNTWFQASAEALSALRLVRLVLAGAGACSDAPKTRWDLYILNPVKPTSWRCRCWGRWGCCCRQSAAVRCRSASCHRCCWTARHPPAVRGSAANEHRA